MDAKRPSLGLTSRSAPGGIDNTWCNAALDDAMPCGAPLNKHDKAHAYQDKLGYWWCQRHQDRGWLLDYGHDHDYPLIRFSDENGLQYAMGGHKKDPDLWKLVVLLGHSNVIRAAMAYLQLSKSQSA